jgi:serine/threonine protein kinase
VIIQAGQTLLHYRLIEKIGEGGMGVVWKAVDSKLDREVAIKVLPETFSADIDRLARFEREAKLLASLSHPGIAAIYGLEEAHGVRFLVMELVPGEDLAQRLSRGALPVEDALSLCLHAAEALEAAHESGVVHRDLKPANMQVTPEGKIKILDFGLAKALHGEGTSPRASLSPTVTSAGSVAGAVLGTAPYLSPEQARGKPVDKRTDIWAFGCVLYEVVTGNPPFHGETVSDTVAHILEREPDWTALPSGTPSRLRALLARCLTKNPMRRLRDIGEARVAIHELQENPSGSTQIDSVERDRSGALAWLVAVGMTVVAAVALWAWNSERISRQASHAPTRLVVPLPPDRTLQSSFASPFAISPDGKRLVLAIRGSGRSLLYLRELNAFEFEPIAGTEGATQPFFSPDGEWVGFFAHAALHRVALAGGSPFKICDVPTFPAIPGATWGTDDTIVFSGHMGSTLRRVSAAGGAVEELTTASGPQEAHRWPHFLPDGRGVVYTVVKPGTTSIAVHSFRTGTSTTLDLEGTAARYVRSGHLVYSSSSSLVAVPFDPHSMELKGTPTPVVEGIAGGVLGGTATAFAISESGSLVYLSSALGSAGGRLVRVDRQGRATPLVEERGNYMQPHLSPDGGRVAFARGRPGGRDIWIHDLSRGTRDRLTTDGGYINPIWSADGAWIAFSSTASLGLYVKPTDGSAAAELLLTRQNSSFTTSWSRDGEVLTFYEVHPETSRDIWTLRVGVESEPQPFLVTPFSERAAMITLDGRWMAYVSDESGRDEVYVRPFPGPGGKWTISTEGGTEPIWSADGTELFYRQGSRLLVVAIDSANIFSAGRPRVLFENPGFVSDTAGNPSYGLFPDGQSFIMVEGSPELRAPQLRVRLNWTEELKRKVQITR